MSSINNEDEMVEVAKYVNGNKIYTLKSIILGVNDSFFHPSDLTLYNPPTIFPKIRIGHNTDGGYIISSLPPSSYNIFISAGIANDISFEKHFLSIFTSIPSPILLHFFLS